jgi:very-short-patch-repair endonuclease
VKRQTKPQNGSYIWSHHEETKSEQRLAKLLGKAGIRFSREVPIKGFTVDFLIDQWLVIEVDGESHLTSDRARHDASRQKAIEDAGFTVLRIPAHGLSSSGEQKRWLKKIRETLSFPPHRRSEGFQNQGYLRQMENVRKALLLGEKERLRRESLAYNGLGDLKRAGNRQSSREEIEETMEDYFGKNGEDFATLLSEYDQETPAKDKYVPKRTRETRKNRGRRR